MVYDMMQGVLPKLKNAFIFKKIIVPSSTIATKLPHFFHSTAPNQTNSDKTEYEDEQQPGKSEFRFVSRKKRKKQRRAYSKQVRVDAKQALTSGVDVQYKPLLRKKERREEDETDDSSKKTRSKAEARCEAKREAKRQQRERRQKRYDQFDENPNIFHATFGNQPPNVFHANCGNKWYTWNFRVSEDPPSQSSTTGFEWREKSWWSRRKLESDIESDSDGESCFVGKDSDRSVLGLPAKGPLKISDIKNAFRLSALKWHPDRHQGPTQASAEVKFKRCVDAYKSMCDALSTA